MVASRLRGTCRQIRRKLVTARKCALSLVVRLRPSSEGNSGVECLGEHVGKRSENNLAGCRVVSAANCGSQMCVHDGHTSDVFRTRAAEPRATPPNTCTFMHLAMRLANHRSEKYGPSLPWRAIPCVRLPFTVVANCTSNSAAAALAPLRHQCGMSQERRKQSIRRLQLHAPVRSISSGLVAFS